MAILSDWWTVDLATLLVTSLTLLYLYFKTSVFRYWANRGVPFVEPSFPFGNVGDVFTFRRPVGEVFGGIYDQLDGQKFGGFFQLHKPTLMLRDLDLIKTILVKDFQYFQNRGLYHDEENDPLMNNLVFMGGPKWKALRSKLTPTFTSGKMKMMFHTLLKCGEDLVACVKESALIEETVEMQDILARYSTDVVASCAFGIECNCLKNPDAEFRKQGRAVLKRDVKGQIGMFMMFFAPSLAELTKWGNTPKNVARFFIDAVQETVDYREENNVTRNDFMQLLIQLKNRGTVDDDATDDKEPDPLARIDMNDVAAQAFVFYVAGFETSSATMAFALYELAVNPDVQTRLGHEIDRVLHAHGTDQPTYDAIMDMEYLDRVIAETLRKYPPLVGLDRVCNTDYTLPAASGSGPGVVVLAGTKVVVPVYAIHHDPHYWPDPHRFDPERFTKEMKAKRNPYAYMPFGEGPRSCIGMRFGLMQSKLGLVSLLQNYEFRVSSKTVVPIVIDPKLFLMGSKDGVRLQIALRPRAK